MSDDYEIFVKMLELADDHRSASMAANTREEVYEESRKQCKKIWEALAYYKVTIGINK